MTWVVMLVALLAGSIAAAVVWQIAERDSRQRRIATTDEVLNAVRRARGDMLAATNGSSALIDADGQVSTSSFERFAANVGEDGSPSSFAWMTRTGDGTWIVQDATTGSGQDPDDLAPDQAFPAGSDLATAADAAVRSGRTSIGMFDRPSPTGTSTNTPDRSLFVVKPVYRPITSPATGAGRGTPLGVLVALRPEGDLTAEISTDLDQGVRFSVADGRSTLATSDPPPARGARRTTLTDQQSLEVSVQDDRPVNHDLSWFLLWISGIVFAAAGTVGLRSARYDEDRRRANRLITRTAELAQDLARSATVGEVATVIGEQLPILLGADHVAFGEIDATLGRIRFHDPVTDGPASRFRLADLEVADAPTIVRDVGSGHVVVLRTPEQWRSALPTSVAEDLLRSGAATAAVVPLEVSGRGVVAVVAIIWRTAPELDQRMVATLDTVKELSEQTLGRAELTDRVSAHASQMAVLAERLAGTETVVDAIESVTQLAAAPVGAVGVRVELTPPGEPFDRPTSKASDPVPDDGRHLSLQLRADGTVIGSVRFDWPHVVAFDRNLVNDLTTVSEITAQSIRRAHLVEQLRGSVLRNQALAEFAQHVANVRNAQHLCRAVADHAATAVGAAIADIGLVAESGASQWIRPEPRAYLDLIAVGGRPDLVPPARDCLRSSEAVLVSGRTEIDSRYPPPIRDALHHAGIAQTAHLPLIGPDGGALGVLGVGWTSEMEVSDAVDARLQTLGGLCSQTIQRVRLAEAEHRLVVSLQERVVRPAPPTDHLVIAERYLPASEQVGMGGDWFEGIPIDEHRFAVVVGDIAGHGIAAVADMVELRAIIGSLLRSATPLGEVYPRVAALLQQAGSDLTATSCTAVFDTAAGTVEYVSAGHLPPVLGRPDGTVELLTEGRQPLLGVPSGPVAAGVTSFGPGAVLAIYTDGIVERRGEPIDVSLSRIRRALRELLADPGPASASEEPGVGGIDVEAVADGLLRRCLDDRATDDDVALVVISHVRP